MHTKSLVEHVDLYPTFAELAGIAVTADAHESIEGSSYASLFATGAKPSKMVWTNTHNASFTQYPRCGETINADGSPGFQAPIRCASVSKEKFVFMGYSMRTTRWRYTEWAPWNGAKLKPEWCADPTVKNALVELYDHEGDSLAAGAVGQKTWDDFENVNVASQNEDLVKELSQRLRAFYATNEAQRGAAYGA
jgi:iduronate 2-sulfatase